VIHISGMSKNGPLPNSNQLVVFAVIWSYSQRPWPFWVKQSESLTKIVGLTEQSFRSDMNVTLVLCYHLWHELPSKCGRKIEQDRDYLMLCCLSSKTGSEWCVYLSEMGKCESQCQQNIGFRLALDIHSFHWKLTVSHISSTFNDK
jgi:hypothetical protein